MSAAVAVTPPRERPINLTAHEVRGILDGRQSRLRRIAKFVPREDGLNLGFSGMEAGYYCGGNPASGWVLRSRGGNSCWNDRTWPLHCPFGKPGDRRWVRETWAECLHTSPASDEPLEVTNGDRLIDPATSWTDTDGRRRWNYDGRVICYRATSKVVFCDGDGFTGDSANRADMPRWHSPVTMPRWASRITLEITDVQVERPDGWFWLIGVCRVGAA